MFPIRNAVNTRLFGAYEPQKIIFDLSHYTKSRPAFKSGGFFAWIDRKEAKKIITEIQPAKLCNFHEKEDSEWQMKN